MKKLAQLLLLSLMTACSEERAVLILTTENTPSGVARIDTSIFFGSDEKKIDSFTSDLNPGINKFLFNLPVGRTGPASIRMQAIDMNGCRIGSLSADISIERFETIKTGAVFAKYSVITQLSANLFTIWGAASDDIWAAGSAGTIAHWDGKCWTNYADAVDITSPISTIHGLKADDIWAAGNDTNILHFDGVKWSLAKRDVLAPGLVQSVRAFSSNEAWMVGYEKNNLNKAIIYRWNGSSWEDRQSEIARISTDPSSYVSMPGLPTRNDALYAIAGNDSLKMMLAGNHRQRNGVESGIINDCAKDTGETTVSCGLLAAVSTYRFSLVDLKPSGIPTMYNYLHAWTAGDNDFWFGVSQNNDTSNAADGPILVHWDGTTFKKVVVDTGKDLTVDHTWGVSTAPNQYDMWVNAYHKINSYTPPDSSVIYRNRGGDVRDLKPENIPALNGRLVNAIWGISANDVWLVGQNGLRIHWDGSTYTNYP